MRVAILAPLTHLCPFVDERDVGSVEASWAGMVELHALAAYLRTWTDEKVSHEDVTAAIAEQLAAWGGQDVEVITRWTTAGLSVAVTASA